MKPHLVQRIGDRGIRWRRVAPWLALAPAFFVVSWLATFSPRVTERVFSRGVYDVVSVVLRFVAGLFPFSLGETLVFLLLVWGGVRVVRGLVRLARRERSLGNLLAHAGVQLACVASLVYALFLSLWGFHYSRVPFGDHVGLDVQPATRDELRATAEWLVEAANARRAGLGEDAHGVVALIGGRASVLARLGEVYARASEQVPVLAGLSPVARRPLLSPLMTAAGIAGIYWPFTGEAHVNGQLLAMEFPFAACHEVAHARGFAREDEANYIAYLVCELSEEPDFRYSGALVASLHALRALQKVDATAAAELVKRRSPAVQRDREAMRAFWNPKTKVVRIVRISGQGMNDAFLKANRQAEGIASYGAMVDLLIARHRSLERAER